MIKEMKSTSVSSPLETTVSPNADSERYKLVHELNARLRAFDAYSFERRRS